MKSAVQKRSLPRRCLFVSLCFTGVLLSAQAGAEDRVAKDWGPKHGVTFGGSAAWAADSRGDHIAGGGEVTYFHRIRAPVYGWISAGYRALSTAVTSHVPYIETGATLFFLNLGFGIAPEIASGSRTRLFLTGFAGVNLPIYFPSKERVLFMEPYYRPGSPANFDGEIVHEVGVMLKFFWALRGD